MTIYGSGTVGLTALPAGPLKGAACTTLPEEAKQQFFSRGRAIIAAKRVCETCPVKQPCLDWVLSWECIDERAGVFGGLSAKEREHFEGPTAFQIELAEQRAQEEADRQRRIRDRLPKPKVKASGKSRPSLPKPKTRSAHIAMHHAGLAELREVREMVLGPESRAAS